MALNIDHVASSPLTATLVARRPASVAAAQAAAQGTTDTTETQGSSSFQSLLASSSAAKEPAATAAAATAATDTAAATTASSTANPNGLSDFELLFGGPNYNPADPMVASNAASTDSASAAEPAATPAAPPTAQSVFGANVWLTDPIGMTPDNTTFEYNPIYFATETTAQTVAQMVGGTVVSKNMITQPGNTFVQQQPNYMVQMPDGALINPGLVASFYTFGFSQSQIDTMIAQEVANTPAPVQTT